jgi:hypothetical protein
MRPAALQHGATWRVGTEKSGGGIESGGVAGGVAGGEEGEFRYAAVHWRRGDRCDNATGDAINLGPASHAAADDATRSGDDADQGGGSETERLQRRLDVSSDRCASGGGNEQILGGALYKCVVLLQKFSATRCSMETE